MSKRAIKISQEIIDKIRELRLQGQSQLAIAKAVGISQVTVSKYCKDIPIDLKSKRFVFEPPILRNQNPVTPMKLSELPLADQKKYAECKPSPKNNTDTYTFGRRGDYGKAAIFDKRNVCVRNM